MKFGTAFSAPAILRAFTPVRALALATPVVIAMMTVAQSGCEDAPPEPDPAPDVTPTCQVDLVFDANSALPLAIGEVANETLCPARDGDWYRFNVDGDGKIALITLSMDTSITAVEPGYSLFDGDGNPLGITGRHPNRSPGEPVNFTGAHALPAGAYIVVVADVEGFDQNFDISNPFSLSIDLVDNPDANEVNDSAETATLVTLGADVTGLIGTTGDEDWFAIPVEQDAQIITARVSLPAESTLELVADLFDQTGTFLVASAALAPADAANVVEANFRVGASGVAGDTWFLRIKDRTGDRAEIDPAIGTYTVNVALETDPDVNEAGGRNDTVDTATTATSGASFTGRIASRADNDIYRFDPPAGDPNRVLVVTMQVPSTDAIQTQLQILAPNPEDQTPDACGDRCDGPCLIRGGNPVCGETRLQRLPAAGAYTTGFPIRNRDPVFIVVNDLFDDQFVDGTGDYTIAFELVNDPDPGEPDNYLVASFQTRPIEEGRGVIFERSRPRARNRTAANLMESCPYVPVDADAGVVDAGVVDAGPADVCLPTVAVPTPGQGGQVEYTVACNGEEFSSRINGVLAYEGDRDFFVVNLPDAGYWGLTASYTTTRAGGATTPVELTVFFHEGDGNLFSSFLESESVQEGCLSSDECPAGSICIDETCWRDSDSNPTVDKVWPTPGECFYTHVNDTRPVVVEVTDNGVNDFDLALEYDITLTARCGCPAVCDNEFLACQGVAPPP